MADYLIRAGRKSDAAELAELHASVQLQAVTGGKPHPGVAAWVEGLLTGHPTVAPEDFLVAEDRATGRAVASLVSLRQEWSLAGLRLPVGQIELVGTLPEHRGNKLTERLFAVLHEQYASDGVALQVIEGIPYFYRRLGYEYALANDGAAAVPAAALPATGRFTVRPATAADSEALADIDEHLAGGKNLTCPRTAEVWRHEIAGRAQVDLARRAVAVLVQDNAVRGYLVHGQRPSATGELYVFAAACRFEADWPEAATSVWAYLGQLEQVTTVRPLLGPEHPLALLGPAGAPRRPRGWYVRTGDPADLITRLQPLLRKRWQDLRWPEPTLTIDLYGRSAQLEFSDGELTSITSHRGVVTSAHAAIPPGALLQLVLGHRTLPEVLDTWPDCLVRDRLTEHFLTTAFPRVSVHVWPRT